MTRRENIEIVIQSLQSSPIFHFSLGSKELFHSNFLAWLMEQYPDATGPIFAPYLNQPPATPRIARVFRERGNIDLTLVYDHDEVLIIENKVKSLPDMRQLQAYSRDAERRDGTSFLLLSLSQPSFLDNATQTIVLEDGTVWQYLSYTMLVDRLQALGPSIQAHNPYHAQLLADYCAFVSHLVTLYSCFLIDWSDHSGNFFASNDDVHRLREIRLHDLIDKIRFAQLAQAVRDRLRALGFDVIANIGWDAADDQVLVDSGMTRGVGLFDLKYVIVDRHQFGNPVFLGVQLQGTAFRLVLEHWDKQKAQGIAEQVFRTPDGQPLWFDFSFLPAIADEHPKKRTFNQYSGTFFYRSKEIRTMAPATLVDTVVTYAQVIRQNKTRLRQHILSQSST